jgi:hypothetical protein
MLSKMAFTAVSTSLTVSAAERAVIWAMSSERVMGRHSTRPSPWPLSPESVDETVQRGGNPQIQPLFSPRFAMRRRRCARAPAPVKIIPRGLAKLR